MKFSAGLAPAAVPFAATALLLAAGFAPGCVASDAAPSAYGDSARGARGKADGLTDPELPCDVLAVVENHCVKCHSGPSARKGVHMDSYAAIVGPLPSNPSKTVAEQALARMQNPMSPMPPLSQFQLQQAQIDAFAAWVNAGAPPTGCEAPADGGLDGNDGAADSGSTAADPFLEPPMCSSGVLWMDGNTGSPHMNPGRACLSCHKFTPEAPVLAFAGTAYPTGHEPNDCFGSDAEGAVVVVTDANGIEHAAAVNAAGNFGIFEGSAPFAMPYTARIEFEGRVRTMTDPQTVGDCNGCHTQNGKNGAPGRIALP